MYGEIGIGMILIGIFLDIAKETVATERMNYGVKAGTIVLMWGGLAALVL